MKEGRACCTCASGRGGTALSMAMSAGVLGFNPPQEGDILRRRRGEQTDVGGGLGDRDPLGIDDLEEEKRGRVREERTRHTKEEHEGKALLHGALESEIRLGRPGRRGTASEVIWPRN